MKTNIKTGQVLHDGIELNTQSVKEALMREAVKQCDCYCTDLLYFLEGEWPRLISGEILKYTIYFRSMSVDWTPIGEPDRYRSKATLTRDMKNDTIELKIEHGNV